jgi:hypothetical protein
MQPSRTYSTARCRQIARRCHTIARHSSQITGRSARVSLTGAAQTRSCGPVALKRGTPTDVTAGLVLVGIYAVREVTVAGGLVAIGRDLVAVGAHWSRSPLV